MASATSTFRATAAQMGFTSALSLSKPLTVSEPRIVEDEPIQIVQKRVVKRVEVPFVRKVKVPAKTELLHHVPNPAIEIAEGYRVDEVEETKIVEVEELQTFELRPVPVGEPIVLETREVGRVPGSRLARSVGPTIYSKQHPEVRDIDEDSMPDLDATRVAPVPAAYESSMYTRPIPSVTAQKFNLARDPMAKPTSAGASFALTGSIYGSNPVPDTTTKPAGDYRTTLPKALLNPAQAAVDPIIYNLGMVVKNTSTRQTDGSGVMVSRIDRNTPAARAGLQSYDIITHVNGQGITTVEELKRKIVKDEAAGKYVLLVCRDGKKAVPFNLIP